MNRGATSVVHEEGCGAGPVPPEFERQGQRLELPKNVLTYHVRRTGSAVGWDAADPPPALAK